MSVGINNNKPLISVIVAVYGAEEFLPRAIESLINQTYTSLEIILVDDGSPGRSPEICDEYKKKDERIRVVHKKNGGASDACNVGLSMASGEYIAFLDCDDYAYSNLYETLFEIVDKYKCKMSVCNYTYVDEKGNDLHEPSPIVKDELISDREFISRLSKPMSGYYITTFNKLYHRELWDKVKFPTGRQNEDNWIIHELISQCDYVYVTAKSMIGYTQREGSLSRRIPFDGYYDNVEAFISRMEFCNEREYFDLVKDNLALMIDLYIQLRRNYLFHIKKNYLGYKMNHQILRKVRKSVRKYHNYVNISYRIKLAFPMISIFIIILNERICGGER